MAGFPTEGGLGDDGILLEELELAVGGVDLDPEPGHPAEPKAECGCAATLPFGEEAALHGKVAGDTGAK